MQRVLDGFFLLVKKDNSLNPHKDHSNQPFTKAPQTVPSKGCVNILAHKNIHGHREPPEMLCHETGVYIRLSEKKLGS